MAYSEVEKAKIDTFYNACDDLIGGKFILSNIKITAILKTIASSDTLYNLFSRCMNGFNFTDEFNKATNGESKSKFDMPKEDTKIIAFVFCLLLQVDNKKINLQNFVKEYFFNPDGYNISYANFAKVVLIPFKEAMHRQLDEPEEETYVEPVVEENDEDDDGDKVGELLDKMFDDVKSYVDEIQVTFRQEWKNKKTYNEVDITIRAMKEACEIKNYLILNALVSALDRQITGKRLKLLVLEIEKIITRFHYEAKKY